MVVFPTPDEVPDTRIMAGACDEDVVIITVWLDAVGSGTCSYNEPMVHVTILLSWHAT
jgi:hypothetical protein